MAGVVACVRGIHGAFMATGGGKGSLRMYSALPRWATVDPWTFGPGGGFTLPLRDNGDKITPGIGAVPVHALVDGSWVAPGPHTETIVDPLNGEPMLIVPNPTKEEVQPFIDSLKRVPKSGLHNPFKNPERYLLYGEICHRAAAAMMRDEEIITYFAKMIQRVSPKSRAQAVAEVVVTRRFLENFGGDQVRFLARNFGNPGDHYGQATAGYRYPYGPVAVITPFNFPLEIPLLQLFGALFMGNKPLLKVDSRVSIVMEQFLRFLHDCGMPKEDVDLVHCSGEVMHHILLTAQPRNTLFTGSGRVAELLAKDLHGKIKVEDAGFDWKILGPDADAMTEEEKEMVAYISDKDAYACTGQKCSAQSILFVHENWNRSTPTVVERMKELASQRTLQNLTVGPTLTVTTEAMQKHCERLLEIRGSRLLFGGKPLTDEHAEKIPERYGAFQPTAVFVPLAEIAGSEEIFKLVTTEIFGPFQVVTEYGSDEEGGIDTVLSLLEKMNAHLTAAVVSKDVHFIRKVIADTVNGTTYVGLKARTTGAPQNHWFGPAGDPRGAGIGTPEAIHVTWSCHREIITDEGSAGRPGPPSADPIRWKTPAVE